LGNFNQLYKLKQQNRNLKTILSVGGWSYRDNFKTALATNATRHRFAESSLQLIADLGLDGTWNARLKTQYILADICSVGFDIDWEYPEDATDAENLVKTLKLCRSVYDEYAEKNANGYHFELDISAPAGPSHYTNLPIAKMDQYIDGYNLMAFDYQVIAQCPVLLILSLHTDTEKGSRIL